MVVFFNKGPGGKYVRLCGCTVYVGAASLSGRTEQAAIENTTTTKSVAASYQTSLVDITFPFFNFLFRVFIFGCSGSLLLCVVFL